MLKIENILTIGEEENKDLEFVVINFVQRNVTVKLHVH